MGLTSINTSASAAYNSAGLGNIDYFTDLFNEMGVTETHGTAIRNFRTKLIKSGIWGGFLGVYLFYGNTPDTQKYNLINGQPNLIFTGGKFVNNGYNPSTDGGFNTGIKQIDWNYSLGFWNIGLASSQSANPPNIGFTFVNRKDPFSNLFIT